MVSGANFGDWSYQVYFVIKKVYIPDKNFINTRLSFVPVVSIVASQVASLVASQVASITAIPVEQCKSSKELLKWKSLSKT